MAVWSFLYFVNVFPMDWIFYEILNLCEVRKFRDDPASRSRTGTKWINYFQNFKEIY